MSPPGRLFFYLEKSQTVDYTNRLEEIIQTVSQDLGLDVLEYDMFQAGQRKILRLFIDKDGGVNVTDCSKMSRELGAALDLEDLLPFAYVLEVSSPGLDRPLKTQRDFLRQRTRPLRLQLIEPHADLGRKVIGELVDANEQGILLNVNGVEFSFAYGQLLSAKVEVSF